MRLCCVTLLLPLVAATFSFPLCFFSRLIYDSLFILAFQFILRSHIVLAAVRSLEIRNAYLVCKHVVSVCVFAETCLAFIFLLRYGICVHYRSLSLCVSVHCAYSIRIAWVHVVHAAVATSSIVMPIQYHTAISKSQPWISFSAAGSRVPCASLCCITFCVVCLFILSVWFAHEARKKERSPLQKKYCILDRWAHTNSHNKICALLADLMHARQCSFYARACVFSSHFQAIGTKKNRVLKKTVIV